MTQNITLHEKIKGQIIEAMRAKDAMTLETLRGLTSLFSYELISKKSSEQCRDDESALTWIKRSVKQRKDSIDQFVSGGRPELAEDEKAELAVLETYLPQMMSEEDVMAFAKIKLAEAGEVDKSKAGMFMGTLMKELKGKADGDIVKKVVDSLLG